MRKLEHILAAVALVGLIITWIFGWKNNSTTFEDFLNQYKSETALSQLSEEIYTNANKEYFVLGEAKGYGGPMKLLAQFDSTGVLTNILPVDHKETVAFFQKAEAGGLFRTLQGYSCKRKEPGLQNVDAVSGATITSTAIINSVSSASGKLAFQVWDIQQTEPENTSFSVGLKEITLLALFLVSLLLYNSRIKYKKQVRIVAQILSIVVLGFVTTTMMSIVHINSFLMLYFPEKAVNISWYILLFILFVPLIAKRKNYYCGCICPFGATQEFLGKIGGEKKRVPDRIHKYLVWIPRLLAWVFILMALASNNPGIRNHEVFSAFFRLTGHDYLFAILGLVLVLSTFIKRPWCNYLCPIRGTTDYVEYWLSLRKK